MTKPLPQALDFSFMQRRTVQMHVGVVTIAFAFVGLLYGTFWPKRYRSTLTVVSAGQQKSGMASLLGSQLGGLSAAFDVGGGADAARIAAVLQSTAVTDAVIEKFDLKTRYGQKYQETTRSDLWSRCNVAVLPKPNLVQLSCEDRDPRFAQEMLLFFADYGNQVFRRVSSGSASEEVRFLERNVAELRRQADEAGEHMRHFQETHQIVDLDSQARAVVSSVAALSGQRMAKQMELNFARAYASVDEATARQMASQLSVMDEQLRNLRGPRENPAVPGPGVKAGRAEKSEMFPAALAVPKLRAEFEKLYRDRRVAEATLVFALERLEAAKAAAARDVSTFQVLDPPVLPQRHSSPQRGLAILLFAAVGFGGAVAIEWLRQAK